MARLGTLICEGSCFSRSFIFGLDFLNQFIDLYDYKGPSQQYFNNDIDFYVGCSIQFTVKEEPKVYRGRGPIWTKD